MLNQATIEGSSLHVLPMVLLPLTIIVFISNLYYGHTATHSFRPKQALPIMCCGVAWQSVNSSALEWFA